MQYENGKVILREYGWMDGWIMVFACMHALLVFFAAALYPVSILYLLHVFERDEQEGCKGVGRVRGASKRNLENGRKELWRVDSKSNGHVR